jgi:predicted nuclease of predicted toxin-antitoxin system
MLLLWCMGKKFTPCLQMPEIKFFLDECIAVSIVDTLMDLGFSATHARTVGLRGASDKVIAAHAKKEHAILLTKDLEFGSLQFYPPGSHYGVVVLRLPFNFKLSQGKLVLQNFLKTINPRDLVGSIVVVQLGRYRIRKFSTN